MDQDLKQELGKLEQNLKQGFDGQFKEVNKRIDKMSEFMMTHVALKEDLKDLATKDDLQTVKSDIFDKLDALSRVVKKVDEEKTVSGRRLDTLEAKLEIV